MNIELIAANKSLVGKEKSLQLSEGQIFSGKVVKILSNDMAEVMVGSNKLIAKLETPLQAGERYWFNVTSVENGLELKVVADSGSLRGNVQQMAESILKQLMLPPTKENKAFVQMMIKEGLPLTKDMVTKVGEWFAKSGINEGIQAIKAMIDRSLPFTKDVFQALVTAQSPVSFGKLAEQLAINLQNFTDPPESAVQLLRTIKEWQQPVTTRTVQQALTSLIEMATQPNQSSSERNVALHTLKSLGLVPNSASTIHEALEAIIQQWKVNDTKASDMSGNTQKLPIHAAINELQAAVTQMLTEANSQAIERLRQALLNVSQQAAVPQDIVDEIDLLLSALKENKRPQEQLPAIFKLATKLMTFNENQLEAVKGLALFLNQREETVIQNFRQEAANIVVKPQVSLTPEEALFQQLHSSVDNEARLQMMGKEAYALIKEAFTSLGVDLEARLGSKSTGEMNVEQMMKTQLLKLLGEEMPLSIRDLAEKMIGRINAQHILSAENGPLQQLIMQIPLNLFGFQTDLTLQWSGRKKENGQLDADYCRVLFYLNLEHLQETVIDMQVQNRIISLQIFNDTPGIQTLAAPMLPALKAGVETKGYQLSTVQFKQPEEKKVIPFVQAMNEQAYAGVDIRI
ncbi:hypothetical protein [Bacillus sp. FJAT-52991]|uniref:Glycosyltransferase n=1 Tax=Bacillus kandeliae TaxID=3129297 RepID=A0ABZ2N9N1_9BACI